MKRTCIITPHRTLSERSRDLISAALSFLQSAKEVKSKGLNREILKWEHVAAMKDKRFFFQRGKELSF